MCYYGIQVKGDLGARDPSVVALTKYTEALGLIPSTEK